MASAITKQATGVNTAAVEKLKKLGVHDVLLTMAEAGQIIIIRCEMPQCYCPKGRSYFDPKIHPASPWTPSPDHYPQLKADGGHRDPWNIRLSHLHCNNRDYGWRTTIRTMLRNKKSLEEISERLTHKQIAPPHGHPSWSPTLVRKAFVS
jgi:hypothetical protein